MRRYVPRSVSRLLFFVVIVQSAVRSGSPSAAPVVFTKEVAPILARKCLACHAAEKPKGAFRMDTFEMLMKPGDSKRPPFVAGKPEQSLLFKLLTHSNKTVRMPQDDEPLPREQIATIKRWIREGAKFEGDVKAPITSLIPRPPHPSPPEVYRAPVPIVALAFHPNGNELAVGGYHEITIWSIDGKSKTRSRPGLLRRIKNVAERVQSVDYSPDGQRLAAGCGVPGQFGEVSLCAPATDQAAQTIASMRDVVLDVKFSPDGKRLATAGTDNTVRIFEVATRKEQLRIEQHADWVSAIAWSPEGTHVASASRDRTARVFNATTGSLEETYAGHTGPVIAVAFSTDGKRILTGGREKAIHLWNAKDGTKAGEITGIGGDILRLIVRDDEVFSSCTDNKVREHSIGEKKLLRTFELSDWAYGLALHPATSRLTSGSFNGEVRVWKIEDASSLVTFIAAPGFRASPCGEASLSPLWER